MNLWLGLLLYILVGVVLYVITIVIAAIYTACQYTKGNTRPSECLEAASGIWDHPEMRDNQPVWWLIVRALLGWPIQLPTGISALVDMMR